MVVHYRNRKMRRYFRPDAAFDKPELYEFLETEHYIYAVRLPTNPALQKSIPHLPTRPTGCPPTHVRRTYASFSYQAAKGSNPRRWVAKVEYYPGELYLRVGFIVTNLSRSA